VPLDLFPAEFLDSINIVKSYSPDLPGDFSGGLIKLDLRDIPDELTYSVGLSVGANTQTTFQDTLGYSGSTADWFAMGEQHRDLDAPDFDLSFPDRAASRRHASSQTYGRPRRRLRRRISGPTSRSGTRSAPSASSSRGSSPTNG
jgi:hypothetical protein